MTTTVVVKAKTYAAFHASFQRNSLLHKHIQMVQSDAKLDERVCKFEAANGLGLLGATRTTGTSSGPKCIHAATAET